MTGKISFGLSTSDRQIYQLTLSHSENIGRDNADIWQINRRVYAPKINHSLVNGCIHCQNNFENTINKVISLL